MFLLIVTINCYSQKTNNLLFDLGFSSLTPGAKEFGLIRKSGYYHDTHYNLNIYPKFSYGFKSALGYEFNLKTLRNFQIKLPLLLSYRMLMLRNEHIGESYEGFSRTYFVGTTKSKSILKITSASTGLNYTQKDFKQNEIAFDALISLHIATNTNVTEQKIPSYCLSCFNEESKSYNDNTIFTSFDFKLSRLYKIKKALFGPFLSYNINTYSGKGYQQRGIDYKLNNPYYFLTYYYHFLETGLKLKI